MITDKDNSVFRELISPLTVPLAEIEPASDLFKICPKDDKGKGFKSISAEISPRENPSELTTEQKFLFN